ncbi:hypothetical protein CKF59_05185 [Psittacicella gerlachiana]|uniref:Uncharacterized protein n=2 Tax=Psittacicella gerlachiana TaxID=2028574 RepID=A0A3A1YAE7_9GAMM|nr:hypothetical protein CKF59_05185 [Psittacicella gerlachiana]
MFNISFRKCLTTLGLGVALTFVGTNLATANNASFSQPFMPMTLKLSAKANEYLGKVRFFNSDPKARGYQKPTLAKTPLSYLYNSDARLEPLHKMMMVYYQKVYDYFANNQNAQDHNKFIIGLADALMPFDLSSRGAVFRTAIDRQLQLVIPNRNSGISKEERILMKDFMFSIYTSQMMLYCNQLRNNQALVPTFCNGAAIVSIINANGFKSGAAYFRRLGFLAQIPQEMDKLTNKQKVEAFGEIIPQLNASQEVLKRFIGFAPDFGLPAPAKQ